MVRLKDMQITPKNEVMTFQFQNGSIKSLFHIRQGAEIPAFQFQNGSIKSGLDVQNVEWSSRFNSKMVRLKVTTTSSTGWIMVVSIPKWFD